MEQIVQNTSGGWGLWIYGDPKDIIRENHSKYATERSDDSAYFIRQEK